VNMLSNLIEPELCIKDRSVPPSKHYTSLL